MIAKLPFFFIIIAVASAAATGSLISFKSEECEKMAAAQGAFVFGESMKMYSAVGVMFVDQDVSEASTMLSSNSDFADCIAVIEAN